MAELNFTTEHEWHTAYNNAYEQGETAQEEFVSKYGINFDEYRVKSQ